MRGQLVSGLGALILSAIALVGVIVLAAVQVDVPSALYAVLGVSVTGHLATAPGLPSPDPAPTTSSGAAS